MKMLTIILITVLLIGCGDSKSPEISADDSVSSNKESYLLEVDEYPKPLGGIQAILDKINYPESAKEKGIEGKSLVKAYIDEEGKVNSVEIVKSADSDLDEAAKKAILNTKFSPAKKDGQAVKAQLVIPVLFKLDQKEKAVKKNGDNNEMPMPVGGMASIMKNLHYPEIARRAGIEGKVLIKAIVNNNGDVIETEVIKGVENDAGLNEAAQDAIKATKFIPAKKDGKKVKAEVVIPVVFKLN